MQKSLNVCFISNFNCEAVFSMLERFAPYFESRIRTSIPDSTKLSRFLSNPIVKHYLDRYRLLKLKNIIKYCYNKSPFYRELFRRNNLQPNDVKTFDDLSKIPFTNPKDLNDPERFFAVPETKFAKIFSSSGTTGEPKAAYYTKNDLDKQITRNATGLHLIYGVGEGDRIRLTYDFGYGLGDWGIRFCLENAIHRLGAMSIVTGKRLPADQELELLKTYKVNMLAGTTSYIYHLTCEMEKLTDLRRLKLKNLMIGSEPLPQAIRDKLEKSWNTKAYQGYGISEVGMSIAGECLEQDGMHIIESDFYIEIIDPEAGKRLEDGAIGEIIITTLGIEGMPLLRYRTHDLGLIMPEDCPCGLPFKRIKILGRTDNMVPIGSGDNLSPIDTDDTLLRISSVIDYQIIVDKKENKDQITVLVETKAQSEKTRKEVETAILKIPPVYDGVCNSHTIERPIVKLVKPNTLDKSRRKTKRIIDKRNLYE